LYELACDREGAGCAPYPNRPHLGGRTVDAPTRDDAAFSAVAEARYGILQYFPREDEVGKSIEYYGEYLQAHIAILQKILPKRATAIEIGAGVGAHTLAIAALSDNANIIAYEQEPVIRRVLRQNLRANKVGNVTIMPASPTCASKESVILDDLAFAELDLIKVNDSSSAFDVLSGAEQTLWRLRPTLLLRTSGTRFTELRERIASFGYRCWRVDTPLFSSQNFNRREENVFGARSVVALLGIPEENDVGDTFDCAEVN
jgi:hypothetical protein